MQNPQMAAMANMNAQAGPMDGNPVMTNGQNMNFIRHEMRDQLNTYIYDYFIRNNQYDLARMMLNQPEMKVNLKPKSDPNSTEEKGPEDLPLPFMPAQAISENSFLLDWWCQFWDIFSAARNKQASTKAFAYINHMRNATQAATNGREQRMMMAAGGMNTTQYQNMMRAMPNGVPTNDLKRAAAMNNRPNGNPMASMNQMKNQAMIAAQMQRDGSQMDMNGQRPQSPGSNENGGSPNKRPRVEGAMAAGNMPGNQFGEFPQQGPNAQQKQIEGMNQAQGSPMNPQGLNGETDLYTGNAPRPGGGVAPGPAGQPQGNHALQDYQMQLMLLEQQNKKRLLMARQEQDNMSVPHGQAAVGGPGFPPSMSPQGSRSGPSPNPADQMKKGTPRLGPQGLPGSPMPEGAMQPQRNSPAPGVAFDPNQMPPGMPPQYSFPGQMPNNPMMRPPSSHPQYNGQPITPQQMEAMRNNHQVAMQNGWRGPPGQPGMMPGPQQMGPMGNNPQQRSQMPPPPAPAEQPRAQEPSPSVSNQAPPTPSTGNKPAPKKKATKDNKAPNKKGANTGATPAASGVEEPATPTAPITPVHPNKSFPPNGQQQPPQPAQPQPSAAQQQQQPPAMDNNAGNGPFGHLSDEPAFDNLSLGFDDQNGLENFDFDSFLHVGDDSTGFGSLGADFNFDNGVEAGGEL